MAINVSERGSAKTTLRGWRGQYVGARFTKYNTIILR